MRTPAMGEVMEPVESRHRSARPAASRPIPMDEATLASVAYCTHVAKEHGKNFYYGMRLTPEPRRSAMYAIYAFMRACDDLADDAAPDEVKTQDAASPVKLSPTDAATADAKLRAIELFRKQMQEVLETGKLPDEALRSPHQSVWPAFLWTARQYHIDPKHLHEMLDGQRCDLVQTRYRTFDQLADYCHKVAGVVGLVCIEVWGAEDIASVKQLAEYRGLALQLTNIIRDLVEDAQRDRIYLPTEDLERFGYSIDDLRSAKATPAFDRMMNFQIERARSYYEMSNGLEAMIDADCRSTSWAIMRIYRELLEKISADPRAVLRGRVKLTGMAKVSIAARAMWQGGGRLELDLARHAKIHAGNRSGTGQQREPVVIVGGGLAGIAAALRLAEHHVPVTVIETRQRLGGRATSFEDPKTGQTLDNCQHVLMGCCTNLLDLYGKLGVKDRVEWHRKMYFVADDGTIDTLEADDLPAPLHMTSAMLKFKGLTWGEKIAIGRAMHAMMRTGVRGRAKLANTSFAQWLSDQQQPEGAIRKFWDLVVVSALNETLDRASAMYALQVFQEGFLCNAEAYVMGLSTVPLVQLYDAAAPAIERAGGSVLLSTSAEGFEFRDGQIAGLRIDGNRVVHGAAYLSALPFDRLNKICTDPMRAMDARLQQLDKIEVSPILGVHLWLMNPAMYWKPVLDLPHVVLSRGPLQWVFNKGMDKVVGGQHLHGVISAAHALVNVPAEKILEDVMRSMREQLPALRDAVLVQGRVMKEKRATFSIQPGIDQLRPGPRGAIENLYLSGDWCDSGWPATMEGAVRTGYRAAAAVLADVHGVAVPELVDDLPATSLYRMIAG